MRGAAPALTGLLFLGTPTEAMKALFGSTCCRAATDEPKPQPRQPRRTAPKPVAHNWYERVNSIRYRDTLILTDETAPNDKKINYYEVPGQFNYDIMWKWEQGEKAFAKEMLQILKSRNHRPHLTQINQDNYIMQVLEPGRYEQDEQPVLRYREVKEEATKGSGGIIPHFYTVVDDCGGVKLVISKFNKQPCSGIYTAAFSVSEGFDAELKNGTYKAYKVVLIPENNSYKLYYRVAKGKRGKCELSISQKKADLPDNY